MSKTSTKRALNRNHNPNSRGANQTHSRQAAAAEAKTRRNTSSGRPLGKKKTRKKQLSRQQAAEVRDTLNAEFRDLRRAAEVSGPTTERPTSIYIIIIPHSLAPPSIPLSIFCFFPPLCGHITFSYLGFDRVVLPCVGDLICIFLSAPVSDDGHSTAKPTTT